MQGLARDMLDSGAVGTVARALEEAGWHGLAFTEHPAPGSRWLHAGGHQSLDPFVALVGAATVTKQLQLLTYLAVSLVNNVFLGLSTLSDIFNIFDDLSMGLPDCSHQIPVGIRSKTVVVSRLELLWRAR